MRITFVLPGPAPHPMGGFKVVYEYANGLAARGHAVTVVHPAYLPGEVRHWLAVSRRRMLSHPLRAALDLWRPTNWFAVDPRVNLEWVRALRPQHVPDADAIVATWWQTAEILAHWPRSKGSRFYLIQHLETWAGPRERVLATWRLALEKIVIARWLEDVAGELGERCHYIPNGIDFAAFGIDVQPVERRSGAVAMLYHKLDWKGSTDGLAALCLAKQRVPGLQAELFGTSRAPAGLPDWIRYHRNPPQSELRAIYNRAAVFVAPSWTEGWPLPPAEALGCGCALACTDIGGHREYARQGTTALTSPIKDPSALAHSIVQLASDDALRLRLAAQGRELIRQFTWQTAVERFERVLMRSAGTVAA